MKSIQFLILVSLFTMTGHLHAQKGRGGAHHPHHNKVVVVKRSHYRPHKVVVYHPHWHPQFVCHRRWVFFPKYNLYWDNWRNHYVYWNGKGWVSEANKPAIIVNVNLEKEKRTELKEDEDDTDEIYLSNTTHQSEYKSE